MKKYILFSAVLLTTMVSLFSCNKDKSTSVAKDIVTVSDKQAFGADSIRSWVKTDANGTLLSVGVTFKASALPGLPARDTMFMLMPGMTGMGMMMPKPFDHIEIDWAPNGDPLPSIYNVAHLDCHFFLCSMAYQAGIMGGADSGTLNAEYIPLDCRSDGEVEAEMGMHWVDTTGPEYHGMTFSHALTYGFYHSNMTFIEAMCSKAFLDSKAKYTGVVKQPASFRKSGYYPMNYTISYDAVSKEYTYSLDNLKAH